MVDCNECHNPFEDGGNVNECSECVEPFCDDCKEEHNCVGDFDSYENKPCADCGKVDEEMSECSCSVIVCSGCEDEHRDSHKGDISFDEVKYEDYITEKTADEL